VPRADAGESIVYALERSKIFESNKENLSEEKVAALAEICVLMGALEHLNDPKLLANAAKHFAFSRCGEFNV